MIFGRIYKQVVVFFCTLLIACSLFASSKTYTKSALTGGTSGALDSIDGSSLSDGDRAIVFTSTYYYIYYLDSDNAGTESSPNIISPDSNAGTKRWVLISDPNLEISVGDNGQIKIGDTTGNPEWANITPTDNEIEVINDTNSITLKLADNLRHGIIAPYGQLATESKIAPILSTKIFLGTETRLYDLITYNDEMYMCSYPGGKLYVANLSVPVWTEITSIYGSETYVVDMVVYNDEIYAGTGNSGYLLKWDGAVSWTLAAGQYGSEVINKLIVYNNKIYAGTSGTGLLLEWDGVSAWTKVASQLNTQIGIKSLVVLDGTLYAGTANNGQLFMWNGTDSWVQKAPQMNTVGTINDLVVFNGEIYAATADGNVGHAGALFKWDGVSVWNIVAIPSGAESGLYSLLVYDGAIYGTGAENGNLLKWNGEDAWGIHASNASGPVRSIINFNDTIYCGGNDDGVLSYLTYPSGKTTEKIKIVCNDEASQTRTLYFDMGDGNRLVDMEVLDELSDVQSRDDEIDNICDASQTSGALMQTFANSIESKGSVSRLLNINNDLDATPAQIDYICDGVSTTSTKIYDLANNLTAYASEINKVCDGNNATASQITYVCTDAFKSVKTWDCPSIGVGGNQATTLSVTGAAIDMFVVVKLSPTIAPYVFPVAYVSSTNNVVLKLVSLYGATYDPPSADYTLLFFGGNL